MSKYVMAKVILRDITFEEVKHKFPEHTWNKIPNLSVVAYASSGGLIFKDYHTYLNNKVYRTSVSLLYDCNNDCEVYTRISLLGATTNKAHRLIAQAFLGESNLEVNHIDCNKGNNNSDNLEYMTRLENARHALANGRHAKHYNISNEERARRSEQLKLINYLMKIGKINRKVHHTKWTDEHKLKHKEAIKDRPRDNEGRFIKVVI